MIGNGAGTSTGKLRQRPGLRWGRFAAHVTVATLLGLGCSDSPTGPSFPSDAPYMQGRVTSVTTTSTFSVSILVERDPSATSGPKAVARVDDVTLVRLPGNGETDYRAISVGQWVRLWFEGPVTDTYPVQGTARAVAIDSTGSTPR